MKAPAVEIFLCGRGVEPVEQRKIGRPRKHVVELAFISRQQDEATLSRWDGTDAAKPCECGSRRVISHRYGRACRRCGRARV